VTTGGDERRRALHVGGIRWNTPRGFGREVFRERELRRYRAAQHVGGDLDIDRPRRIAVAHRGGPGFVQIAQQIVGRAQRARAARYRFHDRNMVDPLERTEVVLRYRCAAADQQHRHALELRIGHGGDAVGDAGPGRYQHDADSAGEHRMRVRHVHGRAFVAHVDDAHLTPPEVIPDRLNVAALQTEHAIDAARNKELRNPFGNGTRNLCAHQLTTRLICRPISRRKQSSPVSGSALIRSLLPTLSTADGSIVQRGDKAVAGIVLSREAANFHGASARLADQSKRRHDIEGKTRQRRRRDTQRIELGSPR
jgi:hypothetical protein